MAADSAAAANMGFFYTGKGDQGESHIGAKKYPKDSPVLEALGELDELNSFIGWVRSYKGTELGRQLKNVQETLFIIQARVGHLLAPEYPGPELAESKIRELEQAIEEIEAKLQPERGFVIPGADPVSAQLDILRAVSRRVERAVFRLHKENPLPQEILTYLNRLSSYFFALARLQVFSEEVKESKPKYE
ncbi:MAG: cob(I)yrinic acid a,c-diamide adenosyltransferase [Candidatus Yanofskybacteria bacterium]|nr:cob(I)yrinic acid a,c-diamide adenosyltransferase [Candidatus Yanofskybacteria bacterium]